MISRSVGVAVALAWVSSATLARAEPDSAPVRVAEGERHVDGDRHAKVEPPADAPGSPTVDHRKGRPPARPSPTLPPGAARPSSDEEARRSVAGGPTADDITAGTDDPELRALRAAEGALFAKPLQGVKPGWSWELPTKAVESGPAVFATGLPPSSKSSDVASTETVTEAWLTKLRMPDLPVRLEARVVKYLEFYKDDPRGRRIARAWAKKSGRLAPALKAEFARAGLPTDLVWLSLIESGHNPTIVSPAGAAGLWQFIPESGRMYGLVVDRWVDERLDPERATEAAIRYLSDLHARFGRWELAMAAYNMGQGGLLRAVRKYNTNDFWVLSRYEAGIPWETTLYVPKIFAIAVVMNNRDLFGIDDIEPDPPISFDTVYVEEGTSLSEVARAAQIPESEVTALNAHYLAGRTPPTQGKARFRVRVPAGRGLVASASLAKSGGAPSSDERYVVRYGDMLELVAKEHGISESNLRRMNGMSAGERLTAGTVLMVPAAVATGETAGDAPVAVVPARRFDETGKHRVFYQTLRGDTLQRVGRAFGVSAVDLAAWNALDSGASLHSEMMLQIYVSAAADLSRTRYLAEEQVRVVTAGSDEFFEHFEGLRGRHRITVEAEEGDTLAKLGRRYGMSGGMMERINRFSRRKQLASGDRVIVYAKAPAPGAPDSEAPGPLAEIAAPRPDLLPSGPAAAALEASNGTRSVD